MSHCPILCGETVCKRGSIRG